MRLASRAPTAAAPPTGRRASIALFLIVACQLMVVLDATVVNIALTRIRSDLHFSPAELSWVVDAYTLTFGGLLLLGGRAGDIFGRRRMLLAGLTLFTLSSLAGGLAPTAGILVAARAVQGIGAAMAAPSTLALITATFEEGHARNKALGLFSAVSAGGGSLGLILGGLFTSYVSWRWVLFINVPIGAAVIALAPRFVVEPPTRRNRLDLPGALLSTGGLGAVIYGFIRSAEGGNAAITAAMFVVGVALLAGFLLVESRVTSPLVPLRLLTERTRGMAYLDMLLVPAAMFGMFFFTSQFMEQGLGFSAVRTGFAFLPLTAVIFGLSRVMPRILARTGTRPWLITGPALVATGLVWLSQAGDHTGYWTGLFGPLALFGIGAGLCFLPLSATILSGVPVSDAGAASGMLQTMQQSGGSIGVAVLVAVAPGNGRSAAIGVAAALAVVATALSVVGNARRAPAAGGAREAEGERLDETILADLAG